MTRMIIGLLWAISIPVLWAEQTTQPTDTAKSLKTFQRYLAQLQQKPDDEPLRKKLVQLAPRMKPAPEIPAEARHQFSSAYVLQREAKSQKDFEMAVAGYKKALELAPWWAAAYYHLGTAYERLGKYDLAIENLKLFLASEPGDAGEREAQDRIEHLEKQKSASEKKVPPASR